MARDLTAQIDPSDPVGVYRNVSNTVPLGKRYGTATEVANMVTWLLSSESEYVSGTIQLIDGALNA
jgi:NAD(P)-dependent dehydrogenase (short-subunit alcohol dehydrogenase family)